MTSYVIKAEDLVLLNDLPQDYPRPVGLEWINRTTDQKLRRTLIDLLIWTIYPSANPSPRVVRLH